MNQAQTTYRLATQAYTQGDFPRANQLCDQLLTRMKDNTDLLNLKAMSCLALGRPDIAKKVIERALRVNPRVAGFHLNAALVYQASSEFKLVKRHALEAVQLAPREAGVLYQGALMCRTCGDRSRALRILDRCLQIQPDFADAWHLQGSIHTDLGDLQAAQQSFEKAVSLQPLSARALSMLVGIRQDELSDDGVVAMLENIRANSPSPPDRASATFTLADMHRRDAQHDVAFNLYREANGLMSGVIPFKLDNWQLRRDRIMSQTESLMLSQENVGEKLVFIVGMPRSGTTLCEQVLSAHPDIFGCGEMASMQQIEIAMERLGINPYGAQNLGSGISRTFQDAGLQYISTLPKEYQEHRWVTDKAPMNFERIGLIHKMFPAAHFIYCKRNPLDTILSCYFQDFHDGLSFASDLEVITQVYIDHVRFMQHWSERIPGKIHTVEYESLVSDLETEVKNMSDFLGCDYDADMLNPHEHQRVVATASNLQVRKPVYTSSINKWKDYRSHLDGVIGMLKEHDLLEEAD